MTASFRRNDVRARDHAGYWAFVVHRVSGLALTLFLPLHFLVLSRALRGSEALDGALAWTNQPWVKLAEVGLVLALALHLAGGVRLLFIELVGWRENVQKTLVASVVGISIACALLFALNLVR
jgi:fumarate reductase subunit D